MRWQRLVCVLAMTVTAHAAPGGWRFDDTVAGGGSRQARRIAAPASGNINFVSAAITTTTTPAPTTKKLVTLAPGGDNIQAILFNNGYRDRLADEEPEPNNIEDDDSLDGLDRRDVWLQDGNLLVLKGGAFSDEFSDTEPLDDYQAPYREPKFPPPDFLGEEELPPSLLTAWQFGFPGFPALPLGPEQTFGYQPYGRPEPRPYTGPVQPLDPEQRAGYSPLGRPEPRPDIQPETAPDAESEAPRQPGRPANGQKYGDRRREAAEERVGRYMMEAPLVKLQLPTAAPGQGNTYSVRTSYSSTSSESSTSVTGRSSRYLPPPRARRRPDPR